MNMKYGQKIGDLYYDIEDYSGAIVLGLQPSFYFRNNNREYLTTLAENGFTLGSDVASKAFVKYHKNGLSLSSGNNSYQIDWGNKPNDLIGYTGEDM